MYKIEIDIKKIIIIINTRDINNSITKILLYNMRMRTPT